MRRYWTFGLAAALVLTSAVAWALPVEFRIGTDDRNRLYTSTSDTTIGAAQSGYSWWNTGTTDIPLSTPTYLHIHGREHGGGQWTAAYFKSPPGTVFQETGGFHITTNSDSTKQAGRALWSAYSEVPKSAYGSSLPAGVGWENPAYIPWDPNNSPYPPNDLGPADSSFPPGTRRIWYTTTDDDRSVFYSTRATLLQQPTEVSGTPEASIAQPEGLSAHFLHPTYNLGNINQAESALTLRPGDSGHYSSQVTTVGQAHLDEDGHYGSPAGYLVNNERQNNSKAEHYATRLAGYVHAPTDGYVRTFAVGSDDGYRLTIGDTVVYEYLDGRGVPTPPDTIPVRFPTAGYWPLELTWYQGGGGLGLEVSSREGEWTSADWNTTDFAVLGTDPAYPIYQRPGGVPAPGDAGLETTAPPLYAGSVDTTKADGLRVQVLTKGTGWSGIQEAVNFLKANPDSGAIEYSSVLDYAGAGGNFPYNNSFPQDAAWDGNNFAMRFNGLVYIPAEGDYAMAVSTDDGYRLRVAGATVGEFNGGRGTPTGWANYCPVHFPAEGLYPVEFYMFQGGGGYAAEVSAGAHPGLLVASRNPANNGLTPDLTGQVFSAEPVAKLFIGSSSASGQAKVHVPALGMDIPPESWTLEERHVGGPGLWGDYYTRDFGSYLGSRIDLTTGHGSPAETEFYFPNNYAYGPWGDREDNFRVRWTGFLDIPTTGLYDFRMDSDDRSAMFIDIDGDGVPDPCPDSGNWAWTLIWNDVFLQEGLVAVEFQAQEHGGGENSRLRWDIPGDALGLHTIPASFFSHDHPWWELLASGTWSGHGMDGWEDFAWSHDWYWEGTLRLTVDVAGLTMVNEQTWRMPEPGTLSLLAMGGLGALWRRRRRRASLPQEDAA